MPKIKLFSFGNHFLHLLCFSNNVKLYSIESESLLLIFLTFKNRNLSFRVHSSQEKVEAFEKTIKDEKRRRISCKIVSSLSYYVRIMLEFSSFYGFFCKLISICQQQVHKMINWVLSSRSSRNRSTFDGRQ